MHDQTLPKVQKRVLVETGSHYPLHYCRGLGNELVSEEVTELSLVRRQEARSIEQVVEPELGRKIRTILPVDPRGTGSGPSALWA